MHGWETVFGAIGGLVVGLGIGVLIGRRGTAQASADHARLARLRTSVIPVLERRASALGAPRAEAGVAAAEPLELAIALATSIERVESHTELPFSDTVDISAKNLRA